MPNEPRTYRNSPFQIGLIVLIFGILGFGLSTAISQTDGYFLIPIAGLLGVILLVALYSMTAATIISDNEIMSQTILGKKSLGWNEISRISGRGNGITLRNNFGDVTVSPRPNLPGYIEVVNWIGNKRPDLFNPMEYNVMSRSRLGMILFPMIGLIFIGFGFFSFFNQSNSQAIDAFFPFFLFLVVGIVFIGMMFATPQSITIDGKSLLIKYITRQKTLLAEEITSIDLRYTQTRNGKNYFIALVLKNNKIVRVSGLAPSLPIAYLVLKNWHKKNTVSGLTI
jgi:hypothetical protein